METLHVKGESYASSGSYEDLRSLGLPQCQDVEEAALTALYNATDGPNWTRDSFWLDEEMAFSLWHGVSEDSISDRVVGLSLPENGLKGQLPPE